MKKQKQSKEKAKEARKPEKPAKVKKTSASRKNLDVQEKVASEFRKHAFSGPGVTLGALGMERPDLVEEIAGEHPMSPPPLDKQSEERVIESRKDSPESDQREDQQAEMPETALTKQEGTAVEALKSGIPVKESWSYAGSDSTAVIDITILEVEDDDEDEGPEEDFGMAEWSEYCQLPKVSLDEKIESGIGFVRNLAEDYNLLINRTQKKLAERAIVLGKFFLSLKDLVRQKGEHWIPWAEKDLPFVERRNREKYMLLAKRKDCHPFSFLGVDRLEMLCSATKDFEGDDPIGYLLSKYNIQFDPRSDENLSEFKNRIDTAINREKLLKKGFEPNFDLVFNLTLVGVSFDKALIKTMKNIRDCGGSPEAYLEKLSMNAGKDDTDDDPEKRLQDFNSLANRLIKTVDYILKAPDQVSKVDKETFSHLLSKIHELQKAGNLIPSEEEQAA